MNCGIKRMKLKLGIIFCLSFLHAVASQQLAPNQLKSKVDEIAKAYAEGYKAALSAIRARSIIERQVALKKQANVRSFIPKPVAQQMQNLPIGNTGQFIFPARQITVNGVEKSGIPRPVYQVPFIKPTNLGNKVHSVVERSAAPPPLLGKFMEQQIGSQLAQQPQQRSSVPVAPAAQPASAGQTASSAAKTGNKLADIAKLNNAARHRNVYLDSMGGDPYGGASGVLSRQYFHLHRHRRSLNNQFMPGARRSRMPYLGQDLDKLGVVRAVPAGSPDASKNALPSFSKVNHVEIARFNPSSDSPYQIQAEKRSVVMPMEQQPLQQQQQMNFLSNPNFQQRSFIPAAPQQPVQQQNTKRDMIAKLNHAARHRNVYLDSMSGDPYGGASGVLSRQHFYLKHRRSAEY